MDTRRITLAVGAAGSGLLAAALLPVVVAAAEAGDVAGPSDNAFTIDGYTFDPGADGFSTQGLPLSSAPPLLELVAGFGQNFEVYDGTGSDATDLGTISVLPQDTAYLFGINDAEFKVFQVTPADGVDADQLPAAGSVYDVANLGGGFANVYVAVPGEDGAGANSITDTLVTPFGNFEIPTDVDATIDLDPGAAFTGLAADGGAGSDNAFTIGNYTFDPGSDGFTGVSPSLYQLPPALALGGGSQDLDVYDGTTNLGSIGTTDYVNNLFGLTNTALVVNTIDPAEGVDADQLPAVGSVYDAFNFGGGFANVYVAVAGDDGANSITDTLVTPFGNFEIPTEVDATVPLDPGAAFTGLAADGGAGSDNAFTIGDYTFDPGSDGFTGVSPLFLSPPVLEVGLSGGQDLDVYNDTGSDLGSISTGGLFSGDGVTELFGMTNTQFTVGGVDAAEGVDPDQLPAVGTVYDVFNLGGGFENVYVAVPGDDGATSIADVFMTPFGNFDIPIDFDATVPLDPGAAFDGLGTAAGSAADVVDPLAWLGL